MQEVGGRIRLNVWDGSDIDWVRQEVSSVAVAEGVRDLISRAKEGLGR